MFNLLEQKETQKRLHVTLENTTASLGRRLPFVKTASKPQCPYHHPPPRVAAMFTPVTLISVLPQSDFQLTKAAWVQFPFGHLWGSICKQMLRGPPRDLQSHRERMDLSCGLSLLHHSWNSICKGKRVKDRPETENQLGFTLVNWQS